MPEPPEHARERKALAREAGRRREAVTALRLAEATCGYGAAQLGNGLAPGEARRAALELAAELEGLAARLRALTRLRLAERQALARQLAALGFPTREIAAQLGVTPRAVRYYVAGRACP